MTTSDQREKQQYSASAPVIDCKEYPNGPQVLVKAALPSISIVTPSYNQGEYLEECIDSVLSQNYPHLQYVIMDGGSNDNSVSIIKKYERYLAYWQSIPDGGQYSAINEGFKKCTGEIMAWINSDDKYHDRAFFTVGYLFATEQHVQWLMGRPSFWDINGELTYIPDSIPTYCRQDFLQKKYNDPFIQQESTFWRRSLYENAGGYVRPDLNFAGDLDLWIRFFRLTELYTVDALLGGYRSHGNQKAVLAMDSYIAEAEDILDMESALVQQDPCSRLQPAPEPLQLSPRKMIAFFKTDNPDSCFIHGSTDQAPHFLEERLIAIRGELEACQQKVANLELRLQEVEIGNAALLQSLSWRVTKPLRWLGRGCKPLKKCS